MAVLVVLAGCSEATPGLEPGVERVAERSDGSYEVALWLAPTTDESYEDASVHVYSAEGRPICAASFGTVSGGRSNATVRCDGFPALLVPGAGGGGVATTDVPDPSHLVKGYVGFRNGSHDFETITTRTENPVRDGVGRSLPPSEEVFRVLKCVQWRRDANVSALDAPYWMYRDRAEPNTTRSYGVRVQNVSKSDRPRTRVHEPSALTGVVRRALVRTARADRRDGGAALNASAFYAAAGRLAGRQVSDPAAVRSLRGEVAGRVRAWNDTGVDCRSDPPRYVGSSGTAVTVRVRHDGALWRVTLRTRVRYSGVAVAERPGARSAAPRASGR